jgi:hypothetical protein
MGMDMDDAVEGDGAEEEESGALDDFCFLFVCG